jgi:hypothetical protein
MMISISVIPDFAALVNGFFNNTPILRNKIIICSLICEGVETAPDMANIVL